MTTRSTQALDTLTASAGNVHLSIHLPTNKHMLTVGNYLNFDAALAGAHNDMQANIDCVMDAVKHLVEYAPVLADIDLIEETSNDDLIVKLQPVSGILAEAQLEPLEAGDR